MLINCLINDIVFPINNIKDVVIRESIFSPIIEGEINLYNFDVDFETQVINNKKVYINFIVYDKIEDKQLLLSFVIYAIEKEKSQGNNIQQLKFCSSFGPEIYNGNRSTTYKNMSYSRMIKKLLKYVEIDTDNVVDTLGNFTTTLPTWSIYQSLNYLRKKCADYNNKAGFLLFPNMFNQKMNLVNYTYLNEGNYGSVDYPLLQNSKNEEFIGKIQNLEIIQQYDLLEQLNKGNGFVDASTFDVCIGEIIKSNKKVSQVINSEKAKYDNFLLNKDYQNNKYSKKIYIPFSNDTELNQISSRKYYNVLNSSFIIQLESLGDYNRKLGYNVFLVSYRHDDDGVVEDQKLSGIYNIHEIEHNLSTDYYEQKLTLSKFGISI